MRKPQQPEPNRDDERAYEAPAVSEVGTVDEFTQGDRDEPSIIDS